jgi:hypothetical protein
VCLEAGAKRPRRTVYGTIDMPLSTRRVAWIRMKCGFGLPSSKSADPRSCRFCHDADDASASRAAADNVRSTVPREIRATLAAVLSPLVSFQGQLAGASTLGVDAVGSDLEGFFDSDEAEGGATVLIGPTLAVRFSDRWRLLLGGGPVVRATTNKPLTQTAPAPVAPNGQAGHVLRLSLRRVW